MVNKVTKFEVAWFIWKGANLATAKAIFNAFKLAWINIYLNPSDFIVYNYEINFNFKKFRILLRFVSNTLKLISVKVYYFINKVKKYYYLLRHAYEIVITKQLELFDAN